MPIYIYIYIYIHRERERDWRLRNILYTVESLTSWQSISLLKYSRPFTKLDGLLKGVFFFSIRASYQNFTRISILYHAFPFMPLYNPWWPSCQCLVQFNTCISQIFLRPTAQICTGFTLTVFHGVAHRKQIAFHPHSQLLLWYTFYELRHSRAQNAFRYPRRSPVTDVRRESKLNVSTDFTGLQNLCFFESSTAVYQENITIRYYKLELQGKRRPMLQLILSGRTQHQEAKSTSYG